MLSTAAGDKRAGWGRTKGDLARRVDDDDGLTDMFKGVGGDWVFRGCWRLALRPVSVGVPTVTITVIKGKGRCYDEPERW